MREEIEAGAELVREFDKFAPVKVAFWLKESDNPFRYLHLASEQIEAGRVLPAYGEILRLAALLDSPWLDPFRVRVLPASDPLAAQAADLNARYPDRHGIRLGGCPFGGIVADDVYIYPPLPAAVS